MIVPGWILSIGLSGIGLYLLIQGVKHIQKAVDSPVLLKLPLTQKNGQFDLPQAGAYSIWQSGRTLQRAPVKLLAPAIFDLQTGEKLIVHPTFSTVRINNGWEGRIQLFTFWAKAGQYRLELTIDASTLNTESPYFLEIRARRPGYILVLGILLLLLAAFCLLTGLVLPFL
ncbi:hypothetical protein G8759_32805 [Spirosoma aureum]|uniref:Uncharacterized protein n=1 Tax=Spirosoma aureum TaxID=2692134 RepID=A0A6G9AXM1_9BACT|nr:hypothetical protein [Spirosoma aureum]QIP17079.1 hypothetical protein G8759_32805 [Spirosoma aureum]